MKKLISLCMALMMIVSLAAIVSADEGDLAAAGWSVDNDNFLGWSVEGNVITGDFNIGWENAEPISLWQDMVTDYNNFSVELDMAASNATSPFIAVMGVRVEADGNGGDGNQVYLKTNNTENFDGRNQTYDWIKAANCKVHVTICRMDGGDLTIQIVGESNENVIGESKTLTVEVTNESAEVKIGVYRGCAKFENLTVTNGDDVVAPTEPVQTEPSTPATEPQPTEQMTPNTTAAPTTSAGNTTGNDNGGSNVLWIVIAAVAVVAVVVVVVISKKKKA